MDNEKTRVDLPSKIYVTLSNNVYDECYCNFDEAKWISFNNFINAGLYFSQILQFITVLVVILNGKTSWSDIVFCNLMAGVGYTSVWYLLKLYKMPGLSFICCFLGGNIFRFYIHFIPLGIISLLVIKDWKILLFCIIGGVIAQIVKTILYGLFATTKYNDEIAKYVSSFKISI